MKHQSISLEYPTDLINIAILIIVWGIAICLVNPIGNFPLNDDWAYGRSVKWLVEEGELRYVGWTATNLFSQILWGALFCLPFGFSFTVLRLSTLVLGIVGVIATYCLLKGIGSNPKLALFGALVTALNPMYFALSNSFMNDVQFFSVAILSLYFLYQSLNKSSSILLIVGTVFALIAILSRQSGHAIPLAFGCAFLFRYGLSLSNLLKGFLPTALGVAVQLGYQQWLERIMHLPDNYGKQIDTLVGELSKGIYKATFNFSQITLVCLIYLGLFLLPILVILFARKLAQSSKAMQYTLLASTAAICVFILNVLRIRLLLKGRLMPLGHNIIMDFGIGPIGLINHTLPQAHRSFWIGVTLLGAVGAALLLHLLLWAFMTIWLPCQTQDRPSDQVQKWEIVFFACTGLIYFLPISFLGFSPHGFYDRYLLFLFPLLMAVGLCATKGSFKPPTRMNRSLVVGCVLLLLYGAFAVGATHDYLDMNRVRWQALDYLTAHQNISPNQIDGGMEFNGWHLYSSDYQYKKGKSWYWVDDDEYVIAAKPIAGYVERQRYIHQRWIPWRTDTILILQREGS